VNGVYRLILCISMATSSYTSLESRISPLWVRLGSRGMSETMACCNAYWREGKIGFGAKTRGVNKWRMSSTLGVGVLSIVFCLDLIHNNLVDRAVRWGGGAMGRWI